MKQTVEEAANEYFQKAGFTSHPLTDAFKAGVKWQMEEERQVCDKCGGRLALVTGTFSTALMLSHMNQV